MRASTLFGLGLLCPLFAVMGCGGATIEELCQRSCECLDNCDTQQESCEKNGKAFEKLSDENGCRDSWDAYVSCLDEELTCTDGSVNESACGSEFETFLTDCDATGG